jgi:tRNA pseudouridine13 synthase
MSRYPALALVNPARELPLFTEDLPGTGGTLKASPEDFEVEEIPAYAPAGAGDHVMAWIEKRDQTTLDAVRALARVVGVRERDIGSAGLKDRRAVTRQWLSFPPPTTPEAVLLAEVPGVRVLSAARHGNKLRTGHLRGNRFRIAVRELTLAPDVAAARAAAVVARLGEPPGAPNWYGEQRFGAAGDNAAIGRTLVRGTGRAPGGARERRLYLSAYQAALFNRYLARRIRDRLYRQVVTGDILRVPSGGMFVTTDPSLDQERLARGEVTLTGPMFGHEMRQPPVDSEAAAREAALLREEELTLADFRHLGKLAPGTRRPLSVPLEGARARPLGDSALEIEFSLPAGAYATVVLREVMKG